MHGVHDLKGLFRAMDDNDDRMLTKDELRYGLQDYNIRINVAEVDEIFDHFDRDRSGAVSYEEFLCAVCGAMSETRRNVVQRAFDSFEKTPFGNVTLEELELAYDVSHNPDVVTQRMTPAAALREFARQWTSVEDEGEISFAEFHDYYACLNPYVEADSDFVRLVCNTWGLRTNLINPTLRAATAADPAVPVAPLEAEQVPASVDVSRHQYRTSSHNAHPDAPRPGKPKVPKWLKYDKVVLKFSMYSKEAVHHHPGTFNEVTREFSTKVNESFTIRKFVLHYYVEDGSIMIMEPKVEDGGGFGGKVFLKRTKESSRRTGGYKATDFCVGEDVCLCGRTFRIYDADKATRDFIREEYPDVRLAQAEGLPKDPNPPRKRELTGHGTRNKASAKQSSSSASRQFMENDGKVLSYDCVWDDTGINGERRFFTLRYYLGDGTVELREMNPRNSGRDRTALLNLNRQRMPNPNHRRMYAAKDLVLGGDVELYGRRMVIVGCDAFTMDYCIERGIEMPSEDQLRDTLERKLGTKRRAGLSIPMGAPPKMRLANFEVHRDPEQREQHLLNAIRKTIEQMSNYGSIDAQRNTLRRHMLKYGNKDGTISKSGFRSAMTVFSCFGIDADKLYSKFDSNRDGKLTYKEFTYQVYPGQSSMGRGHVAAAAASAAPSAAPPPPSIDSVKVKQICTTIRKRLETKTNFVPERQLRLLHSTFRTFDKNGNGKLSPDEFVRALAQFNVWERDARMIFGVFDANGDRQLSFYEFCDVVMQS